MYYNSSPFAREQKNRPLLTEMLRLIWEERSISRAEIARRLGLSRSTVSEIVSNFLRSPLLVEGEAGPSGGGRRPISLEFQDEAHHIVGVEMGVDHVGVALVDLRGEIHEWAEQRHDVRADPEGSRALIGILIESVLRPHPRRSKNLIGIGVAAPCPVDPTHPAELSKLVLPEWGGNAGLEFLQEQYVVPVMIDNDANLGALAEGWWGAGREINSFTFLKIGTGVGAGHMINRDLFRGSTGVAGEIGHLVIDSKGPECICGLRGCLTTFIGAAAIRERALKMAQEKSNHPFVTTPPRLRHILDAARGGDELSCELIAQVARELGIAVSGLLNLMNPECIILGGQLSGAGEFLLEPLHAHLRSNSLITSVKASDLVIGELGERGIALGAATMVLKSALDDSRLFPSMSHLAS